MGSKVIGFRVPDDLAQELERASDERGQAVGEFLRKLVDDFLYPGSGRDRLRDRLEERGKVEANEDLSRVMIRLDNLEQQAKGFSERLDLVQVDRGLTKAEKESLADLENGLAALKKGVNNLVHTVNNNVDLCNEHFVKVARLYQFLAAHIHDDDGAVAVSPEKLLKAEVELADKRLGKIEGQPNIIMGKTTRKGYRYLENLDLSVKE